LLVHAYPRTMKRRWYNPWQKTEYHYYGRPGERTNILEYTKLVLHAADVAIDLGGTIVKLPYIGSVENMAEVVQFVHENSVRVVFAGGPYASVLESLTRARKAMEAGADGYAVGRNFFLRKVGPPGQREFNSRRMLTAIAHIVYSDASVEEAISKSNVDLKS
jgi:fructose-bisphosphate aldolase, class I